MTGDVAEAPAAQRDGHPGERAVVLLREALAKRPEKDDHVLAGAVEAICAWRRTIIARRDAGGQGKGDWDAAQERDLGTLNGVLSLALSIHFPLGDIRWDELEKAGTALASLVESRPGW